MSRSIKDLRDLICVSRLTIRDSDDDDALSSDDDVSDKRPRNRAIGGNIDIRKSVSDQSDLISTPDSGFGTNGHQASDSQNSDVELSLDAQQLKLCDGKISNPTDKSVCENSSCHGQRKKKIKSRPAQPSNSDQPISKSSVHSRLYSAQKAAGLLKNELLSIKHQRVDTLAIGDRPATPSSDFAEGHFEKLLMYVDGGVVSEWLEVSNRNVAELTIWCHTGDNFVEFAHFWLSDFPDKEKFEIFRLEYTILLDQLSFMFAAGLNSGELHQRHLTMFLNAVYREYPARLMSLHGGHLFLDYLDILSSSKQLAYRQLLSDVRCSTRIPQHIQWILATRSYAVVSVWSSVINFYKKLKGNNDVKMTSNEGRDLADGVYPQRMYTAIRCGYGDVVHYLLKSGKVSPDLCDKQQKSLVFYAVMYKQPKILHQLLNQTQYQLDGNQPASNGNTPLHAAANGGIKELVQELLAFDRIKVNACNPMCDNATPLHLAVLHGNMEVVRLLLSAGADKSLKMGALTSVDVAREFGQDEILEFLEGSGT